MTTSAKPASDARPVSSVIAGIVHRASMAAKVALAIALALTPLTAIPVLGWIVRLMQRESLVSLVQHTQSCSRREALSRLSSVDSLSSHARFPGWWSGLWQTILSSVKAAVVVAILTLPFGLLLLVSWWAGWENSFNKGYEQAWAGPAIALAGFALALAILSHLPMAFARFAAEGQIWSALDLRQIRRLIRLVRWRYLALTLTTVLASAPLFAAQIAPTFMEKINPRVLAADPQELQEIAGRWHLMATIYMVVVVFYIRRWAARLYARAVLCEPHLAGKTTTAALQDIMVALPDGRAARRHWAGMILATLLGLSAWFGFVAMLYVAQFANHAWWNWVNHALTGLPWIFRPL